MHRKPDQINDVLAVAHKLLELDKPAEAVKLIKQFGTTSAELSNAYGVALMRAGEATAAVEVYRQLCITDGGFCLKTVIPVAFKINYATALLLSGNVTGCVRLLNEIDLEQRPVVGRLRAAIIRWRRSLGWWEKLALICFGSEPKKPVALDFKPGELLVSDGAVRPAA